MNGHIDQETARMSAPR